MSKHCFSILIALVTTLSNGFAQSITNPSLWKNIETSIHQKKELQLTLNRLETIKRDAQKNENSVELARALCYIMLIRDIKTEDSLYFHNSFFIDSILQSSSNPELELLMHHLQAQRLWKFRTKYLKFNRARYETRAPAVNYAALSNRELDSLINYHFERAKELCNQVDLTKEEWATDKILWLSSSPLTFLFKPNLADIISYEQINTVERIEPSNSFLYFSAKDWLSLSQDQFIDSLSSLNRDGKVKGSVLLFLQWMNEHKNDTPVYYFIETILRESVYKSLSPNYNLDYQKQYETYLKPIVSSKYPEVKARAVYQLCTLWKEWSLKYAGDNYGYSNYGEPFDTSYQQYAAKAIKLYEENRNWFQDFGFLQREMEQLRAEILNPKLQILLATEVEKNKALLLKLQYKNVPDFYYRIVRLNFNENLFSFSENKSYLLSYETVKEEKINLPLPADYNLHRIFLKLPALPPGRYCIIFSNEQIDSANIYNYQSFVVSDIAVLHADDRIYVLNRVTGMPVRGATVQATYKKKTVVLNKEFRSNESGFFVLPTDNGYGLIVTYRGDTLKEEISSVKQRLPDEVFSKDEYDDLVDYYDENSSVMIFTDRGIYRPGQKVFFKAVLITKDPHTGEMMIMNQQNLKKGFHNYVKKWVDEMEPLLYLEDPFGREIDSVKLVPNQYGSVSGYFTIPKNAATGDWSIAADYLDAYKVNNGEFKVEEYKRPTFEITVDKPKKNYKIWDTLSFMVRLKYFSGGVLNHTLVKYQIERQGALHKGEYEEVTVVDSSEYTNEQGLLEIKFSDTSLQDVDYSENVNLKYNLIAEAIDVAGEAHDVNATLRVSTKPVVIRIPFFATVDMDDLKPLLITAKDLNDVSVLKDLQVKLYRLVDPLAKTDNDVTSFADQWIYTPQQLEQWFPDYIFSKDTSRRKDRLIFETKISTADFEKFRWPSEGIVPGTYKIIVSSFEDGFINGENSRTFTIFDSRSKELPNGQNDFFYVQANYLQTGDTVRLFSGSNYDSTYAIRQLKYYSQKSKKQVVINFFGEERRKGIHKWEWKLPADVRDNITLSEVYVVNNKLYRHEEAVTVSSVKKDQPEIIVERFKSQLHPGDSTVFTVSIKTKNENIAAELMTTIYDASLDKLSQHQWQLPFPEMPERLYSNWPLYITSVAQSEVQFYKKQISLFYGRPVWWMDSIKYRDDMSSNFLQSDQMLQGRVPGLTVTNGAGLSEVVVVGYGTMRREMTGSVASILIRGIGSLEAYKQPLIVLDGVPFTGDLSSINMKEVTAVMVLKDAEAVAIYGSRASNGVLIISTKGEIVLPALKQEPVLKIRSNFNETAFFAPAIHANKEGYYTFSFTMPESVTEWNWKLFAHTKSATFIYAERKLVTQLPLMVQPHLPLTLYQGDYIVLKSRISNLDTLTRSGTVICKVEDAVTGEELKNEVLKQSGVDFTVGAKSTTSASFQLFVPEKQLHPLKVIITAKTNEFADGEEHIIPVLSKKILVKENQTIRLLSNDTLVSAPQFVNNSNVYGVQLSIDPKPQTALLNSLPFLAHYSFDCAEQMFNKLFAYAVAVNLVRRDTAIQNLIRNNRNKSETDSEEGDPDSLVEQTMPWLALAAKQTKEQLQLAELLDTMKSNVKIEGYLERLFALQNNDGGVSWFEGGNSNSYISAYILAGFGRLANLGWSPDAKNSFLFGRYENFIQKLCSYSDNSLLMNSSGLYYNTMWFAYARSFWINKFPVSDTLSSKLKTIIEAEWGHENSLQAKALLVINAIRYFPDEPAMYSKAKQQLQSLIQSAIIDDNGIRWKTIADADVLGTSAEETLALVTEAFEAGKQVKEIVPGIIKWLLTYKNEQQWHTTKGTAAVIDLLLKEQNSVTADTYSLSATVNNSSVTVSDDILHGSTSVFHQTKNVQSIQLEKQAGEAINVNLGWYYFGNTDYLNKLNHEINVNKKWYHLNSQTKAWDLSDSNTVYKIGDKVKIVIALETSKALHYVWINDKRSAAFDPEEYNSGYKYGRYFSYYMSIHDDGIDFFAEFIPSGKTEIEYEMVVAQEGTFSGGIAMLQCMYQPSVTSYSNMQLIITKSGSENSAH